MIKDKVVVITGASSTMGESHAKLLASKGAKLILNARHAATRIGLRRIVVGLALAAMLNVFGFAANPEPFRLLSDDLQNGGTLPEIHVLNGSGRNGGNVSPELHWENAPAGTKSFVVTLYDPDAPTGSGWWHWVVIDIPASARQLKQGASRKKEVLPAGSREMRSDFTFAGYGGAAPPTGETHRYVFTVHALNVERLDAPADSNPPFIGFLVHNHSLGSASLTVKYGP
jgi:Raf kinase inhibitor-like YbhB/YbcL family protein